MSEVFPFRPLHLPRLLAMLGPKTAAPRSLCAVETTLAAQRMFPVDDINALLFVSSTM